MHAYRPRPSRPSRTLRSAGRRCDFFENLESRLLLSTVSYNFGVLATFNSDPTKGNGSQPDGLVMDANGNLFGTTMAGGAQGYGTIFEIAAGTNTVTMLANFTQLGGFHPIGPLVIDSSGNIFGAAADGGTFNRGTIFELKAGASAITTLVSFNGLDGAYPTTGVVEQDGILYGITYGRDDNSDRTAIFTVDPNAPVIHDIAIFSDNSIRSDSTLVIDSSGDIFGATTNGGANSRGSIFEIVAGTSTITTLYSFDGTFGQTPLGNLLMDSNGNFIGATSTGGTFGDGTLFSFDPTTNVINVMLNFDGNNGRHPVGNLVFDANGNIVGSTAVAGPGSFGTVFSFDPTTQSLTTLHSFNNQNNMPAAPTGTLVIDADGNIFGGTYGGGAFKNGTLFELSPTGAPQVAVGLTVIQQPLNSLAGPDFSVTVGVEDIFGNLVATDTSNVTVALTTPNNGATLNGTLTETADGGLATFSDLEIDTAGTYSITVTDGTLNKTITRTFTISADANNNPHLVFSPNPGYFTAGKSAAAPFTVLVEDNFGNVITTDHSTITITPQAGLSGSLTAPVLAGVANFSNIKFAAVGSYTLTATDTKAKVTDPNVTGASGDVTVGTISQAAFTQFPAGNATILAGQPLASSINVSLEDSSGHTVTTDSGTTVTLSIVSGPTGGEFYLGGTSHTETLTATDVDGVASFGSVDFDTAGTYTFLATINGIPTVMSKTLVVSPDTGSKHLVFTTQPSDTGIDSPIIPPAVVKIEDQFGNIFTKDNSRVLVAAVGPGAASGTTTVNASSGVATFGNVQFATAGNYTLHATDGAIMAGDSDAFTIGAATHLVFTTEPTTTVAGQTISTIKVSVEDATGHVVAGDTSAITLGFSFFLPGNGATLSGTTTENAVAGVATFSGLSTTTAGNYTLVATDANNTVAAGVSNFFVISPDVPTHLVIAQQPEDVGAGVKMVDPVIVYVEDQFDNIVTTNSSRVTLMPTPGSTVSNASVNVVQGMATFTNFTVNTPGNYTVTASDGALTTAVSDSFDVSLAAKLVFGQGPTQTKAGTAFTPITVKVENAAGQVITTDTSAVTLTLGNAHDPGLTGTLTVSAVNGIATFADVIPTIEGNDFSLAATDGSLAQAVSGIFSIESTGTVTQLVFSQQPGLTVVAGATIAPHVVVRLEDAFGNIVTSSGAKVTLTANGPGAFNGTVSANASSGVAAFSNLVLKTSGDYTLTASTLSLTVDSDPFTVVPAAPARMIFTVQPSETDPNTVTAEVTLVDAFNNTAANAPSAITAVTVAINSGPAGATLGGVITAPVVNGVAMFDDIEPSLGGTFTLKALSPNIGQVISQPFVVLLVI